MMQLIGLLIGMEARFYLLTIGSNWSRVMNELRVRILEDIMRRGNTHMKNMDGGTGGWYNC